MKAQVVKAILNNQVIISAVKSTTMVQKAIKMHDLSPVCSAALGRTITMGALMSAQLKNETDYLSATIKADGPIGSIVVCADGRGNVKGYCDNPHVETSFNDENHLNVGQAVGRNGQLTVVKNIGLKTPAIGTVKLVSGEIAQDFAQYYATSEQQPCAIALGVKLQKGKCVSAGGVMIAPMPDCDPNLLYDIETVCYAMDEISYQYETQTAHEIITKFFSQLGELVFTETKQVDFKCDCSTKRIEKVILSIGKQEANEIIAQNGQVEVKCHFCNKNYVFDAEKIEKLFNK